MKTIHSSVRSSILVTVRRGLTLGATCCQLGCGVGLDAGTHDLGSTADELTLEGRADAAAHKAEEYFGTWIGEADDPLALGADEALRVYQFPSGSSRFELLIDADGGRIRFGEGMPPPVTDFDVGYPDDMAYWSTQVLGSPFLPPLEGFSYPLLVQATDGIRAIDSLADADVADGVIRLFYRQNDYLQDWCGGQDAQVSPSGLSCLGIDGASWNGTTPDSVCSARRLGEEELTPVDCDKLFLCEQSLLPICECVADRCRANPETRAGLFLRRIGDELVGSFAQGVFRRADGSLVTLGVVRFQRVE